MRRAKESVLLNNSRPQDNSDDIVILSEEEDQTTLSKARKEMANKVHFSESDDASGCSCGRGSNRKMVQVVKERLREKEEEVKRLRKIMEEKGLRKGLLSQNLLTKPVEQREMTELIGKVRELKKGWELKDKELKNVTQKLAEAKSLLSQTEVVNKSTEKYKEIEILKERIKLYKKSATLLPKLRAEYGKKNVEPKGICCFH